MITLFPDANLSTGITVLLSHATLYIFGEKLGYLFFKTVSIVSLSFYLVIKGSYS